MCYSAGSVHAMAQQSIRFACSIVVAILAWQLLMSDEAIASNVGRRSGSHTAAQDDLRVAAAHTLLRVLSASGMDHAGITVKRVPYGGLGVFVTEPVAAGATVVSLRSSWMLTVGSPSEPAQAAALPLALARQRRNSTSEILAQYMATLPTECPANLAARGEADLALARLSLQAWKVDLIDREALVMLEASDDPPMSAEEIRWATCTKLSRAFPGVGYGPVMMPLIDLFNHAHGQHANCAERAGWVDEAQGVWAASLIAQRDLRAGEELTFEYVSEPSRARMLSSFGFDDGSPSVTLAANGLPERDPEWFAQHQCVAGRVRTELWLQAFDEVEMQSRGRMRLSEGALRESVRCVRLSLYTPGEAEWALLHGHLDAPWGGWYDIPNDEHGHAEDVSRFAAVLRKDLSIASNTARMCIQARREDVALYEERLAAATKDLRDAIAEEANAIALCAEGFSEAERQIRLKGESLFGWGSGPG